MARMAGVIEYEGGARVTFEGTTAHIAEYELFALRHGYPVEVDKAPRILMMLVVAHAALGVEEGFEAWRRSVVDIDMTEAVEVPPTLPAPSPEAWSSSPSS